MPFQEVLSLSPVRITKPERSRPSSSSISTVVGRHLPTAASPPRATCRAARMPAKARRHQRPHRPRPGPIGKCKGQPSHFGIHALLFCSCISPLTWLPHANTGKRGKRHCQFREVDTSITNPERVQDQKIIIYGIKKKLSTPGSKTNYLQDQKQIISPGGAKAL